jgi:hypothetical protein
MQTALNQNQINKAAASEAGAPGPRPDWPTPVPMSASAFARKLPPSLRSFGGTNPPSRCALPPALRGSGEARWRDKPAFGQSQIEPTRIASAQATKYSGQETLRRVGDVEASGMTREVPSPLRSHDGTGREAPNRSFKCGWEGWGWLGKLCEGYARRGRKAISVDKMLTEDEKRLARGINVRSWRLLAPGCAGARLRVLLPPALEGSFRLRLPASGFPCQLRRDKSARQVGAARVGGSPTSQRGRAGTPGPRPDWPTPVPTSGLEWPQSLSERFQGGLFSGRNQMEKPLDPGLSRAPGKEGTVPENPAGGGAFGRGRRCLGRHSPLRGCSGLAALATAKIPRRRPPLNFRIGSKPCRVLSLRT